MTTRTHKIGLDANAPIYISGDQAGAIQHRLRNPDILAETGAAWVRINFLLGPWSSPNDSALHQGRTWAETYHQVIDQYLARGMQVYGLIGHESVRSSVGLPHFHRDHIDHTSDYDKAQQWIADYVNNFDQIVGLFQDKVTVYESFNEPDDWHGGKRWWIHPTWFAHMVQQIHQRIKVERGLTTIKLITGPLQGLDVNFNHSPTDYLRQTYQYGKEFLGWGPTHYPFDGIGYHLYIEETFHADWIVHKQAIKTKYRDYMNGMLRVIRHQEGPTTSRQLYISEIGWPSNQDTAESKERQAEAMQLELALMRDDPAVALGIWFCTEDFDPPHKHYGLHLMGNSGLDGRKPAYAAFQAFCNMLNQVNDDQPVPPILEIDFKPTNQNVITGYYRVSRQLGLGDWGLLEQTNELTLSGLAQNRYVPYTGPALEALTGISDAQKARLRTAVAEEAGVAEDALEFALPGTPEAAAQFLRLHPTLAEVTLQPDHSLQVDVSQAPTFQVKKVGQIWNRYGWLLLTLADIFKFDVAAAVAVLAIESGGRGFAGDRRMIIRFENHIFYDHWGKDHQDVFHQHFQFSPEKRWQMHHWRPSPGEAWRKLHTSQNEEWAAFNWASNLNKRAAALSISMGLPQVMGFNYKSLGYVSPEAMVEAFADHQSGERIQLLGFFDFVCGPAAHADLLISLQQQDFLRFAEIYNGPGQAAKYGGLLQAAFDAFQQIRPL